MQHIHIHTETEGPTGSPETTEFIEQAIESVISLIPPKLSIDELLGEMRNQLALKGQLKLRDRAWRESIHEESSLQTKLNDYIRNEAVWLLFGPMIEDVAEKVAGHHAPRVRELLRAESVESLRNESMLKCCKSMAEDPSLWGMTTESMDECFFKTCSNVFRYAQQKQIRRNDMVKTRRNALNLENSKAVADGWEPVDSAPSPCDMVSRQEEWELFEKDMTSESPELQHVYAALRDEDGVISSAKRSLGIPSDGSMDRRREALEALVRRKGWGCDNGRLVMRRIR